MIKVGMVGAIGYGGREFMRLMTAHPDAELVAAVEVEGGKRLDEVLPGFTKLSDLTLETFDAKSLAERCDAVFMAVPGTISLELGKALYDAGARTFDLGSDFRLKDPALFTKYYNAQHSCPELLEHAVYGYVPAYRDAIREAQLVAVPGCFPISIITPLRPLLAACTPQMPVIVNAVTGVSGAGRNLHDAFHFPNMNENVRAYKVTIHQHIPELEQETGNKALIQFQPHVVPMSRGILSTIIVRPDRELDLDAIYARYADEPFIRVLGQDKFPDIHQVRGSNFCDFGWKYDDRTGNLVIVSAIDNLCGGTAGMGVQCLNVAFGLDESAGLRLPGMSP